MSRAANAIIIGGGPAGSTAAWRLAVAGQEPLVLDSASFPRVKLCAGWVTPAVWRGLEIDPADYPHTLQPFSNATLELDDVVHETHWNRTVSYGIVRREFDDFLLRRAESAGARVLEGVRVREVHRRDDEMVVLTDAGEFHAPWLIGAGGHHCPVSRKFGEIDSAEAVVVARESETKVGRAILEELTERSGTPELIAEKDFRGYGWYFTKGDFLNVGIGCMGDGRDLHRRCEEMLERLRGDGRLPHDLELEPFKGHAYAIHVQKPRVVGGKGWLLVGDAAGLARGISGEGIGPAVTSASLAAELLLAGRGEAYRVEMCRRLGSGEAGALGTVLDRLPRKITEAMARLVCRAPALRRRLIFEGAFGMG